MVGRRKVGGCVVGGSSGGDGAFVCVGKVEGWGRWKWEGVWVER